MIILKGKTYVAECDGCGESIDTGLRSFRQAVNYISRAEGWENRKIRNFWRNFCPKCIEAGDPDLDQIGVTFRRTIEDD